MLRRQITFACLVATSFVWSIAQGAEPTDVAFFERRIRPLLAEHCYQCHGPKKQENELRLDRGADLFAGGASGRAIVPGKPDASLLIAAVRRTSDDLQMPPDEKLSSTQIADLTRWVEMGAPHPDGEAARHNAGRNDDWQARTEHWAFQPPVAPVLPKVNDRRWAKTSIDLFILARLEDAGVAPAPPADRRTLIRRATFDLTGLPPTPAAIAAFVSDDSPQAFAKVVDRLLASPAYGERWGRHWLDVARYADSNGLDENIAHGNAWRYRDWVIRAFNEDLPYDDFVRAQVAGDLLPSVDPQQRNDRLIATGFLSLGPKVLAEVDERKMEMDIIDEQINTLGSAVLGMTLGCARCHDHKFDPITQGDYYALAGIFKSTHTMDSFTKIARWHENELHSADYDSAKAQHEARLAAKQSALDEVIAAATEKLHQELGQGAALPAKPEESFPQAARDTLAQLRNEIAAIEKDAPPAPTAMGVCEGEPVDTAIHIRGSYLTLGEKVARGIPQVFQRNGQISIDRHGSGRRELAAWIASPSNPLTARVMVNRLWRWHFGRGLVETTDNFGRLGAQPSHPQLLDYLAIEFSRDWSLKNLHRRIMLSAAYQTSSRAPVQLARADPENRLLGRTSVRRLEAEEIRDAMLAVAGSLDRTAGGSSLAVENRKFIFDHTSKDETSYANRRRSVYLPVVRNHLYEAFTLFDYADASVPAGNRGASTVASQALYLLNSDFTADASQRLADRLEQSAGQGDDRRIGALYELVYGRRARDGEIARARSFLNEAERQSSRAHAWRLLCQSVLISNEFFYVR